MDRPLTSWWASVLLVLVSSLLPGASLVMGLAACTPDLPQPGLQQAAAADAGSDVRLELTPAAPIDAALPVLQARLHLPGVAGSDVDLGRVALVHGQVREAHLRQIVQGELSGALSERIIPSLAWIEDGAPGEVVVVVAPAAALTPGEIYAVASGAPPLAEHLQVGMDSAPPLLERIWPPVDGGATVAMGVWCGNENLPAELGFGAEGAVRRPGAPSFDPEIVRLQPEGPRGELRRGAADDVGIRCVRFEGAAEQAIGEGPFVGPPALGLERGAPIASLDPRPFALEAEPPGPPATPCEASELPFGPGCASVLDDRILARSGGAPLLWAIAGEGLDLVIASGPGDPFLVSPLPPLHTIALDLVVVDAAGRSARSAFSAVTLAPMPHVVITEALANPLGPEPGQEWVELYNDGLIGADLGGYLLLDVGGETALPQATLPSGGYALVVNESFVEDDELDPPPAPGTLILRVAKLGKNGLANGGEPLRLKDEGGLVVSRTPATPAPGPGMSLSRISPQAPDGLAASFAPGWPTPGQENILEAETP
jgi:hypothetical protein